MGWGAYRGWREERRKKKEEKERKNQGRKKQPQRKLTKDIEALREYETKTAFGSCLKGQGSEVASRMLERKESLRYGTMSPPSREGAGECTP